MKKLFPLLILVFALGKLTAQSVPNGGFENWNVTTWADPTHYNTSNDNIFQSLPNPSANVTEVTGWTNGVNGAKLTTVAIDGDTIPGFITNSINSPLKGQGGIPYNQKPSGIEIWYNCNEMPGDSGLFGVVFKKSGIIIGAYLYRVTGIVGTPTSLPILQETFSPALLFTPDTVIFAATSSSGILYNKKGVPGSFFTISGVTMLGVASQPALLNGDFINWTPGDTVNAPVGWVTSSAATDYKTTDSYSGNFALKLTTEKVNLNGGGIGVQPEFATTSKSPYGESFQYPYTLNQDTFEFYYKFTSALATPDSAGLNLIFHTGIGNPGFAYSLPPTSGYQLAKIPVDISIYPAVDSVIVNFISWYSAIPNSHVTVADTGSVLEVDNAQFKSQQFPTGIKPLLLADNSLLIYPNPASTQLTVSSAGATINEIRLLDVLGETILDNQFTEGNATTKQNIDVSHLTPGLYFISITSGNKTSTGKITIGR